MTQPYKSPALVRLPHCANQPFAEGAKLLPRISLAQKARCAKTRTAKPKRTISAAGRRGIAATQRARRAKVKSAAYTKQANPIASNSYA
jgi:hypothetical protein